MGALRKVLICIIAVCGLGWLQPCTASAISFGQATTARVLERGVQDFGGFLGVFNSGLLLFGQARRGLTSGVEGGLQLGLHDPDGKKTDVGLVIGGDLKFGVLASGPRDPIDLAIGVRAAIYGNDNDRRFQIGGSVMASHPVLLSSGAVIAPYGNINLRIDGDDNGHSRLEIGAGGGVKWDVSDLLDVFGEIIIDDDFGVIFGLNFKI